MSEKIATRSAYGQALKDFGGDENIIVMDADLSSATMTHMFKAAYPERFFNVGIMEANMVGMAAGLAATGKTVFVNSFAMFSAGKAFEQVRNSVAYTELNVRVVGSHGGITVGEDGATHQCIEDLAIMRAIPGMLVITPCDANEMREAVKALIAYQGPAYLRLGRPPVAQVTNETPGYKFELGKGCTLKDGKDVTIIATGLMVQEALIASERLGAEGISARVIDMHTIKPIDRELVIKAASETGAIVTAEEHNIIGALGGAVAETVAESCPVPVLRVGVEDRFGHSGKYQELLVHFGLTPERIAQRVREALKLKK